MKLNILVAAIFATSVNAMADPSPFAQPPIGKDASQGSVNPPMPSKADIDAANQAMKNAPKGSASNVEKDKVPEKTFMKAAQDDALTPSEIKELKSMATKARSASLEPSIQSIPKSRAITIDFSHSAVPPVIRVAPRQGCSLSFVDVTGKSWNLVKFTNFSPSTITVDRPVEKAPLLTIEAADEGGVGNFAAFITSPNDSNSIVPVVFTVLINQVETDYRVDAIIPTKVSGSGGDVATTHSDGALESALAGITPLNAKKLKSNNQDIMAWSRAIGDKKTMIIRSKATLLAPAPFDGRRIVGTDGTNVYEIKSTNLLSFYADGSTFQVEIKELPL